MPGESKTVIVTGASQGIGAGVVSAFLEKGYSVVANSRNITKTGAFRRPTSSHWSTATSAKPRQP